MRNCLIAILIALISLPCAGIAQESGSFLAGFELGITSATGDFRDSLDANTGFGIGAELRYALMNGLSFGPFLRYNRFGTNIESGDGNYSYNYIQYGGILHLNVFDVEKGKIYLVGGGGMFTPKKHVWSQGYTADYNYETGAFFTGGLGLSTDPRASTIFELEVRYSMGEADYKTMVLDEEITDTYKFNSIAVLAKMSFNSKGFKPAPRY